MFFSKLDQVADKHIIEAIKHLTNDTEFQQRLNNDDKLDELDDAKYDQRKQFDEFLAFRNIPIIFKGKSFKQITLEKWAFLYCIENPIVKSMKSKDVDILDIDIFLYVINNDISFNEINSILSSSFGYSKNLGLTIEDTSVIVQNLIKVAFSPLSMIPSNAENKLQNESPVFDVDWCSQIVSKVCGIIGQNDEYVMKKMSMNAASFYFVQFSRLQGVKGIERRSADEITKETIERTCEIILKYLIEKSVITESEYKKYFDIISTPPTKYNK